jgi:hypothetical protein
MHRNHERRCFVKQLTPFPRFRTAESAVVHHQRGAALPESVKVRHASHAGHHVHPHASGFGVAAAEVHGVASFEMLGQKGGTAMTSASRACMAFVSRSAFSSLARIARSVSRLNCLRLCGQDSRSDCRYRGTTFRCAV